MSRHLHGQQCSSSGNTAVAAATRRAANEAALQCGQRRASLLPLMAAAIAGRGAATTEAGHDPPPPRSAAQQQPGNGRYDAQRNEHGLPSSASSSEKTPLVPFIAAATAKHGTAARAATHGPPPSRSAAHSSENTALAAMTRRGANRNLPPARAAAGSKRPCCRSLRLRPPHAAQLRGRWPMPPPLHIQQRSSTVVAPQRQRDHCCGCATRRGAPHATQQRGRPAMG